MDKLKLFLVSQQSLLRQALACLLLAGSWPGKIGEYNCSHDFMVSENTLGPGIILADAELPETQLNELICFARKSKQKVAIIGSSYYKKRLVDLMLLKADGYLTLDLTTEQFFMMLHKLELNIPIIDDSLIPAMVDKLSFKSEENAVEKYNLLTTREKEVLELLALGFSNSQIASELVISINTVKNHVHNVLEKLTIDNRTQLVSYAFTMGLVS